MVARTRLLVWTPNHTTHKSRGPNKKRNQMTCACLMMRALIRLCLCINLIGHFCIRYQFVVKGLVVCRILLGLVIGPKSIFCPLHFSISLDMFHLVWYEIRSPTKTQTRLLATCPCSLTTCPVRLWPLPRLLLSRQITARTQIFGCFVTKLPRTFVFPRQ